ncbi:MAG: CAP domain-containing protein [Gaiellaceae bacterium]
MGAQAASGARTPATSPARDTVGPFESSLFDRINLLRRAHHLGALQLSRDLSAAAREHDEQMIRFGYFGHSSPDGSAFWQRVESHYRPLLRRRWAVGENLLSASPRVSPRDALAAWLASPEHRATLLKAGWREIGLAVLHVSSAPGVFSREPTTVITADFGVRS